MSRATEVMNNLELAAKKIGVSIEEAVEILLGKHPTHVVVPAPFAEALNAPQEAGTTRGFVAPGDEEGRLRNYEGAPVAEGNATASTETAAGSAVIGETISEGGAAGEPAASAGTTLASQDGALAAAASATAAEKVA